LVTPPKDLSTINAVTLSLTSPVSSSLTGVLAKTVKTSASPPPLIHILLPFKIHALPSSEGTALVLIDAASEPLEGSVRANAAIISPCRYKLFFKIIKMKKYSKFFWLDFESIF
jgi:hypothetical protein